MPPAPTGSSSDSASIARIRERLQFALTVGCVALVIAASVWPCAIIAHSFRGARSTSEVTHAGVSLINLDPDSPAAQLGLRQGDTILSIANKKTNLDSDVDSDTIWRQIPPGANIEIGVRRGGKAMILRGVRPEDPIQARVNVIWQYWMGLPAAIFLALLVASYPFSRLQKWHGFLATFFGFGTLMMLLLSADPDLMSSGWRDVGRTLPEFQARESSAGLQRAAAALGGLGLLTIGILEIRKVMRRIETSAASPVAEGSETESTGAALIHSRSRLSQTALLGAIWAPWLFILLLFLPLIARGDSDPPTPQWLDYLFLSIVLPLGLSAPVGATIVGHVALSHIKRCKGALHGQELAWFAALLNPMLLLLSTVNFVSYELLTRWMNFDGFVALAWGFPVGLAVCIFILRRAARVPNAT